MAHADIPTTPENDRLFSNLAEQIKLPLVQVLHAVEMLNGTEDAAGKQTIQVASRSAIQLIDGYLLAVQLQREAQLELEPVSVSSLLYDTAEMLHDYAKAHGCELQLAIGGRYEPVMAHSQALKSAVVNLGQSFVDAADNTAGQRIIKLAVRRNARGISAGVFAQTPSLSADLLKRARKLQGTVHQPMNEFTGDNAAGVFVAASLIERINSQLRVARLNGLSGLAATFVPSRQLSLV